MSLHRYKTDLMLTIGGVEFEWPATIIYARQKGFAGDRIDPPEGDNVEIIRIAVGEGNLDFDAVSAIDANADIKALLLADWAEDDEAAAEYRAEQRHERAMEQEL
jgi:hypothetical protein